MCGAAIFTMNNPLRFFLELLRQPLWVVLWVMLLMLVNMASLAFWSEQLARLIFITFMISSVLMMALYSRFGFTKILGLGHILWVPLLAYVLIRFPEDSGHFRSYLAAWCFCTTISLAFDISDVWKHFRRR